MSSSNSPCAACKFLRRKCTQGCVFAPYFPPDQPQKFAHVHRVFGASNVAKLLNDLSPAQREDAVNSLAYEAEARLRDPVYGCVGYISILQHRLKQVQHDLFLAKKELAAYIGPAALAAAAAAMPGPIPPFGVLPGMLMGSQALIRDHHHHHQLQQQQLAEAQLVLAAAVREQEIMHSYEVQQQQQELLRLNPVLGFNPVGASVIVPTAPVPGLPLLPAAAAEAHDNPFHIEQLQQKHYSEEQHQHSRRAGGSDEEKRGIGPST